MWETIWNELLAYHAAWTVGLIFFALLFSLIILLVVWISTEFRLRKATRTETIIDHRHSTPTTVDFVITNPLKMRWYKGSFFDPNEFSLVYGDENKKFEMGYVGRIGNNYKFRIIDLEPATVYTDVKIVMGGKMTMKQPVVNIWTRNEKDEIIAISEAKPIDPNIEEVIFKAKNKTQRKINATYFQYAIRYGNSKTRWIDVQDKPFSDKEIKNVSKAASKKDLTKEITLKKVMPKKASNNSATKKPATKAKKPATKAK